MFESSKVRQKMIKNNPTVKETFDLAYQNHQKNNFEVAEIYYKKILKIDPEHFESTYLLGTLLFQINKFKMAKEMLEKSIQLNPASTKVLDLYL